MANSRGPKVDFVTYGLDSKWPYLINCFLFVRYEAKSLRKRGEKLISAS